VKLVKHGISRGSVLRRTKWTYNDNENAAAT